MDQIPYVHVKRPLKSEIILPSACKINSLLKVDKTLFISFYFHNIRFHFTNSFFFFLRFLK